jgi:predicted ATPase/class 3 adenylate cyclase
MPDQAASPGRLEVPEGTVTFLFTDLEGSTKLLEAHPAAYRDAIARHHDLLREAVEGHGGAVFETVGDAVYAAFARPASAVAAALAGQLALQGADWGLLGPAALRARMALLTGEAERQGAHYFGASLHRAGRLLAASYGGQVVLAGATADLVREALPEGAALRDLGPHRLRDVRRPERVFQLLHPELPAAFPPLRTPGARTDNLPLQLTPFVGRARELAAVAGRLRRKEVRLLTLTGPGGVGKTRLALQAATRLLDDPGAFPDGACFVSLAAAADPALVPPMIAQALGVPEATGRPLGESLTEYLRDKRLLLLLDNFEHLLPAHPIVAELLAAAPRLAVLATSRAALRVYGEREYPVPPLAVADPTRLPPPGRLMRYDAVRLFAARARAARPDFAVAGDNAAAVAEICVRLDGLPLALELAAARLKLLPPHALLARLERRLPLLTGGARDAPARHRTLRDAVAWSHDLLPAAEQALFRRLGVFAGGFALEAAEAVCAGDTNLVDLRDAGPPVPPVPRGPGATAVLDGLGALVDHSLLCREASAAGEARFAMLETVREYALERLADSGEAGALRERHARYFLAHCEALAPSLTGPEQAAAFRRLELDQGDLRAALAWAAERGRADVGLRLAGALFWFWTVRGSKAEGRAWLARLLAVAGPRARSEAVAGALCAAGALAYFQDDLPEARRLLERSAGLWRRLGRRNTGATHGLAFALRALGEVALRQGDSAAAEAHSEEARRLYEATDDAWGTAQALTGLGHVARARGDLARARSLYDRALAAFEAHGDRRAVASVLGSLGTTAAGQRETAAAAAFWQRSLVAWHELGAVDGVPPQLERLARAASEQGHPERALRLAAAAAALREAIGVPVPPRGLPAIDAVVEQARRALSEAASRAAWESGRAMSQDEAVTFALAAPAPEGSGPGGGQGRRPSAHELEGHQGGARRNPG